MNYGTQTYSMEQGGAGSLQTLAHGECLSFILLSKLLKTGKEEKGGYIEGWGNWIQVEEDHK